MTRPRHSRKRILQATTALLILLLLGATAAIWKASTELISPARRALQDYHHEWMEKPAEHGITIQRFAAFDGQVPCLLVLPDAKAGLSPRGAKLRRHLEEKGLALPPFGQTIANLVFLHGRNGRKEDLLPIAERFTAVGFRCVLPDLPASGESPLPIVHFGASDFEAAPLFTTLVKRLTVARGGTDPATVQPAQWAREITTPVFIAHGDKDTLIKLEQGRSLYEAYASQDKAWTIVKDGDHNRILVTEHPLYAEMAAWFLKYLP